MSAPAALPVADTRALPLRLGSFRNLLITRMAMMMALQAQAVIVGWQVYSMTKDVFMLGLIGLTEAVPALICALVAGHVVDNGNPKKILLLTIAALFVNTAILLLTAGGYADLPQGVILTVIFIGIFFSGLARGFISPSSFTLLSRIVDKPDMPQAAAWLSSGFQLAAVSGPAIAGLIFGYGGAHSAWWMPVSLMALAFCMAITLRPRPAPPRTTPREPALKSIIAGWRYILGNQTLLSMMALDMFAVMFGGALAMLPAYADQVLHVGAEGLGILRAAPAAGAIITALTFALRPMRYLVATRLLLVVTGYGFSMILLGLSETFWFSVALLAIGGAFDSVSMIMRGTLMQLLTPDDMKGRLSSINSMFIISSNEIGSFVQGTTARLLGLVPGIIFGGCMTLMVVLATSTLAPKFRRTVIDSQDAPPEKQADGSIADTTKEVPA